MSRRIANVLSRQPVHPLFKLTPVSVLLLPAQRLLRLLVVTLAFSTIVIGAGVTLRAVVMPEVTAQIGDTITIDSMHLTVTSAGWVAEHKHTDDTNEIALAPVQTDGSRVDASSGYAMPAAMMPGMPEEGLRRLRMVVTLTNAGDRSQIVSAADFEIVAADGQRWQPLAIGSFHRQHLAPSQTVEGVLFADIPADTPDLGIVWTRRAGKVRLPLGTAPSHDPGHS
jgi:hypothetical protein